MRHWQGLADLTTAKAGHLPTDQPEEDQRETGNSTQNQILADCNYLRFRGAPQAS